MKLTVRSIEYTLPMVAHSERVLIAEALQDKEYKDNKATGTILGTKYHVVCPAAKYVDFWVKVPGPQKLTQEEIDGAKEPVEATFPGFIGRFYRLDGASDYDFTARADDIVIVSPAKARG